MVVSLACKFHKPAKYDDVLTVKTSIGKVTRIKLELLYEIWRQDDLIATGSTVLATIDSANKVIALPEDVIEQLQLKQE